MTWKSTAKIVPGDQVLERIVRLRSDVLDAAGSSAHGHDAGQHDC